MPEFQEELGSPLPTAPVKQDNMDESTVMFPDITTELSDTILQDMTNQMSPMHTETASVGITDEEFVQRFPQVEFLPTEASSPTKPKAVHKKKLKGPQNIAGYLIPQEEDSCTSQTSQEPTTQDTEVFKRPRDPDDHVECSSNKRMRLDENDSEQAVQNFALQPLFNNIAQPGGSETTDSVSDLDSQLEGYEESDADTTYQGSEMDVNQEDIGFPNMEIDFDVEAMLNQFNQGVHTAHMGEKRLKQYVIERRQVLQCIRQLWNCLKNAPTDVMEADPVGLRVPLMPHQRQALKWMKWREEQQPCSGGILADEMGLGKTLQMIALIVAVKNEKRARMLSENPDFVDEAYDDTEDWFSLDERRDYEGKTLVICPASLMEQWDREISSKCNPNALCTFVYHGVENKLVSKGRLCKFDVILTTYNTVSSDYKNYMDHKEDKSSSLFNIRWERIVLDEAHIIRNHLGKICEAVCNLKGKTKWAITGTPIQNKVGDFYSLLKYLNCEPFVELSMWNCWVNNKGKLGHKRLVIITKTLMLRRTKVELVEKKCIKPLPKKHFLIVEVQLDKEELVVYQKLLLYSQSFFMEFLRKKEEKEQTKLFPRSFHSSTSLIAQHVPKKLSRMMRTLLRHHTHKLASDYLLVLIMRLRQTCCHPALIKGMLDKEDTDLDDIEGVRDIQRMDSSVLEYISNVINEEEADEDDEGDADYEGYEIDDTMARNLMTSGNPIFNDDRKSSKVREILKTIQNILNVGEKVIVVSQWTSFLQVIGNNLARMRDATFAVFSGKTNLADRQIMVDRINDYDDKLNVLLLSLTAGAVGLNLVGANHLLLIDNHWNPQLELQAQDRLHRFGQENDVHIYRFICKDTIEKKITVLQEKKLKAASKVLDGKVAANLTIQDLATLFT